MDFRQWTPIHTHYDQYITARRPLPLWATGVYDTPKQAYALAGARQRSNGPVLDHGPALVFAPWVTRPRWRSHLPLPPARGALLVLTGLPARRRVNRVAGLALEADVDNQVGGARGASEMRWPTILGAKVAA